MGDAGLAHLHRLGNLRQINLAGTRVTDDGVLALEKALPGVMIQSDEDMAFTQAAPRDSRPGIRPVSAGPPGCQTADPPGQADGERGDNAGLVASLDAPSDLDADDQLGLIKLAEARAECLGILQLNLLPVAAGHGASGPPAPVC